MDQQPDAFDLATVYLNVSNAALAARRAEQPYKAVIDWLDRHHSGETVSLRVTDRDGNPQAFVTTRFVRGQFTPPEAGVHEPEARFSLRRDYLERVAERPEHYIDHPGDLDWSWITDRLRPFHHADRF